MKKIVTVFLCLFIINFTATALNKIDLTANTGVGWNFILNESEKSELEDVIDFTPYQTFGLSLSFAFSDISLVFDIAFGGNSTYFFESGVYVGYNFINNEKMFWSAGVRAGLFNILCPEIGLLTNYDYYLKFTDTLQLQLGICTSFSYVTYEFIGKDTSGFIFRIVPRLGFCFFV